MNNYITPKINDILKLETVDINTGEILWAVIRVIAIKKCDNDEDFKVKAEVYSSNFCVHIQSWFDFFTSTGSNWSYHGQSRHFQIYEDLKKMLTS